MKLQNGKTFFGYSGDTDDETASRLFHARFGYAPKEIKRYPGTIVLAGPVKVER